MVTCVDPRLFTLQFASSRALIDAIGEFMHANWRGVQKNVPASVLRNQRATGDWTWRSFKSGFAASIEAIFSHQTHRAGADANRFSVAIVNSSLKIHFVRQDGGRSSFKTFFQFG